MFVLKAIGMLLGAFGSLAAALLIVAAGVVFLLAFVMVRVLRRPARQKPDVNGYSCSPSIEDERSGATCKFEGPITFDFFRETALLEASKIKRIQNARVDGPSVHCDVRSNSGLTSWSFSIDFNDHGRITGRYWISSVNYDSIIPRVLAARIGDKIHQRLECAASTRAK